MRSKKTANHGFWTYAGGLSYDSAGNVKKMQLGNGLWETSDYYDERLQIKQIGLGVTDADQNLLKLELGYGNNQQNNGSLREQKITVPGIANPFIQTYAYDDLNRLQSAQETNGGTETWKQTFVIDRYGNREFDPDPTKTTTLGNCSQAVCNPDINAANDNRFSLGQGYSYDQNGNVTQDAEGKRFGYDAENHQKEFFAIGNGGSTPDATYLYDGEGRRVKKITTTETTVFVYNASGQLVAEYSTALATAPQVSYLTTDHLGSPRVVTNENGTVKDRKDYSAFGEESTSSQRSSNSEYTAADQLRQNYTGYEKDGESELEFAQARYYNPTHGRYTSVDPLTASASIKNPQSFNRYSYVLNSPYKYVDPLGLLSVTTGACGQFCPNSDGGGGGYSGRDASFDWAGLPSDTVTIDLNIVYDSSQMSQQSAVDATKATVEDLQSTFGNIQVKFNVTYTAGSSDGDRGTITSGAVDGAINVFFFDNTSSGQQSGSYYNPDNLQIFLARVGGSKFREGALAHEVGHVLRHAVRGDPRTGVKVPGKTGEGWCKNCIDVANYTEDSTINTANDRLRAGGIRYGFDYVDDYRTVTETQMKPLLNKLGNPRRNPQIVRVPRRPTDLDIYRLGAIRIASQRR